MNCELNVWSSLSNQDKTTDDYDRQTDRQTDYGKAEGYLEKVPFRENVNLRDVPKASPRVQPKAFRFFLGGTFFRYHPRLFHNLSDFGFLEVQGSLPRDHHGKILDTQDLRLHL